MKRGFKIRSRRQYPLGSRDYALSRLDMILHLRFWYISTYVASLDTDNVADIDFETVL